jgi:hypothetical protein
MKRIIISILILLTISLFLSAEEKGVWWGSNYMPGNIVFGGTISIESDYWGNVSGIPTNGYESGFGISPQIELLLYKPIIAGVSPMDFGVAAKARTGFFFRAYPNSSDEPFFPVGVAALGTAHFGFKGFNIHFSEYGDKPSTLFNVLSRFDYFVNLGVAFDIIKEPGSNKGLIGFAAATGLNYFANENFSVSTGYSHWNGLGGFFIGGSYKIGAGQKTKDITIDLDQYYYQIYLAQFYSIYWYTFYSGGFYSDDTNYEEGQGTEWKMTSTEDDDVLIMEKSLLKLNSDGSRWWKVKYSDGSDKFMYEFLLDKDYNLLKLKFVDADSGEVREYKAKEEDIASYNTSEMRNLSSSDYKEWNKGSVKIKTEAGSFTADHILYSDVDTNYSHEWWLTEDVPGQMVKFLWNNNEDIITVELTGISTGNKSEF